MVANGIAREKFGVADEAIVDSTAHTKWEPTLLMSLHCVAAVGGDSLPKWVNIGIFRCVVETVNNM